MIRASLFTIDAMPARAAVAGYVQVGLTAAGALIVMAPPNTPLPGGATVIRDGRLPWTWAQLRAVLPNIAERIVRVDWRTGNTIIGATGQPIPEIVTGTLTAFRATGLPNARIVAGPHPPMAYAGDRDDLEDDTA